MTKLKIFLKAFPLATTADVYLFALLHLYFPEKITLSYLWLFLSIGFVVPLFAAFTFKTGLSGNGLWLRRVYVSAFAFVYTLAAMLISGLAVLSSFREYAIFFATAILGGTFFAAVSFYVADKIEKKMLAKINAKLSETKE